MSLGSVISKYRKELGITQESLAQQLEVTNQAVSKWEGDQCCPDVMLLPRLADIFGITIDELFGREALAKETPMINDLPWADDGNLRAVVYMGRKLVGHERSFGEKLKIIFKGNVEKNVYCDFSLECDDVGGHAEAGGNIVCGNVGGDVDAGTSVACGNVEGNVDAGSSVACGDVGGDVDAGGKVACGDVEGNVDAGGEVTCGDIEGDVDAGGSVQCAAIGGDVDAGNNVTCQSVAGDIDAGGDVRCTVVNGSIDAGGGVIFER